MQMMKDLNYNQEEWLQEYLGLGFYNEETEKIEKCNTYIFKIKNFE